MFVAAYFEILLSSIPSDNDAIKNCDKGETPIITVRVIIKNKFRLLNFIFERKIIGAKTIDDLWKKNATTTNKKALNNFLSIMYGIEIQIIPIAKNCLR